MIDPHDPGTRDLEDCLNGQHWGGYVANQLAPLHDALDRLARFRLALNHWHMSSDEGPMPQPRDHGVRLPDLEPVQVHWEVP